MLSDLKQLEKLEKTGEDKKTLYIGGEYPRQLNATASYSQRGRRQVDDIKKNFSKYARMGELEEMSEEWREKHLKN